MITNFPIIQSPNKRKAKFNLNKRDKLCINRLGSIRDRIQTILLTKDQIDENLNLDNKLLQQFSHQLKKIDPLIQSISTIFPESPKKTNNLLKKSGEKLNKIFNRTKTDWQHNFIGEKYLSKIKQQMRFTKYSSNGFKSMQQTQRTASLNKIYQDVLSDRKVNKVQRGLSQSQLEKAYQKIKQKRLSKEKASFDIKKLNLKNRINQKSLKEISQYQKLVAISPWDDQTPKIWGRI